MAQTALRLWKELIESTPNYVGPHGLGAKDIEERIGAVETALQTLQRQELEQALAKPAQPATASDKSAPTRVRVIAAIQRGAEAKELCDIGTPLLEAKETGDLAKRVAVACKASEEETH